MKYNKIVTLGLALFCSMVSHAQQEVTAPDSTQQQESTDELALPEGMQPQEIDSLYREWYVRSFLKFDENCETTGEVPTFTDEEYIRRLNRLPDVIDMPFNEVVKKYIEMYGGRLRRSVSIMLGASNFYTPIFEEALESYQIPLELKYLPIIESALNPNAISRAGAVGLWQFMIGTGKQYGLEVTSLIDERRDPIKASYAAAHYLKDLYDIFGDWTLVIASYNCGPGNVNKAIKRSGGLKDYWQIYKYLPNETRGYVPAFIAANYIMNFYCEHNICPVNTTLPAGTDTIMVNHDVKMEQIVTTTGITMDELKALNPQYRTTMIPGEAHACAIRMPAERISAFLEAGDSVYSKRVDEQIAQNASKENAVEEADQPEVNNKKSSRRSRRGGGGSSQTVTIRQGDNLGAIARRNHTTVAKLKKLNGLRGDNIRAGEKIKVK